MATSGRMERRPVAGTDLDTSVLGITVDFSPPGLPADSRSVVTALQHLWSGGITTFDLAGSGSPAWAAQALLAAFPRYDPDLLMLLGASTTPTTTPQAEGVHAPGRRGLASTPDRPRPSPADLAQRLSSIGRVLFDWRAADARETSPASPAPWVQDLAAKGIIAGWSLPCTPPQREDELAVVPARPPVTAALSLLDRRMLAPLDSRFRERRGSVLVRDPFQGGLLDGTRFSSRLAARGPGSAPEGLRKLSAEFEPVLRLAPLTRERRRTLAQASIQYLLQWPWVATVLLPFPAPDRWPEMLGALSAPPLDEEELRRLGLVPATRPGIVSLTGT